MNRCIYIRQIEAYQLIPSFNLQLLWHLLYVFTVYIHKINEAIYYYKTIRLSQCVPVQLIKNWIKNECELHMNLFFPAKIPE